MDDDAGICFGGGATIGSHVTRAHRRRLARVTWGQPIGLGSLETRCGRQARRTAENIGLGKRLQMVSKRPAFWQVAPDGMTVERMYDPKDEPLDLDTYRPGKFA